MPKRRRWGQYPKRISEQLNSSAGVAGTGAVVLSVGGLFAGGVATMVGGAGIAVSILAVGYAMYKAIPEPDLDVNDLLGTSVPVRDLQRVHPRPISLSIVGPSMSGKTTLRDRLTHTHDPATRTQVVSAHIVSLQTPPPNVIALLDGGGERYPQQFEISAHCDYLCLLVDHNESDTDHSVDPLRLKQHGEFLQQIRHYLDESKVPPKRAIRIVINKRDLWKNASDADKAMLEKFQSEELRRWKEGNRSADISVVEHSNSSAQDIAGFVQYLKQFVESSRGTNVV